MTANEYLTSFRGKPVVLMYSNNGINFRMSGTLNQLIGFVNEWSVDFGASCVEFDEEHVDVKESEDGYIYLI